MGIWSKSRAVITCGTQSWKFAALSSGRGAGNAYFTSKSIGTTTNIYSYNPTKPLNLSNTSICSCWLQQIRHNTTDVGAPKEGGFLGPDAAVDKTGKVNRWSMFVPAFATHVCK